MTALIDAVMEVAKQLKRIADAIDEERKKEEHEQGAAGTTPLDSNPPVRN
jgi:hypothetical protein